MTNTTANQQESYPNSLYQPDPTEQSQNGIGGLQPGLVPLTREKFRGVLGDRRSGCHAILRDNEGLQPQEAVEAMIKFLFAKWYDERMSLELAKTSQQQRPYVFSVTPETEPERLVAQVSDTFEQAKAWEQETLKQTFGPGFKERVVFSKSDRLCFKPHTTVEIVRRLQPWSLHQTTADIKGAVFEDYLDKTFRGGLGQYFTPTPIIKLMVGILQPTVQDFVGDPACGSARMLTHVLDYIRQQEYRRVASSEPGINPEEPTQAYIEFRSKHLFGAEISQQAIRLARVNTLVNRGALYADLQLRDSLAALSEQPGLPQQAGFYQNGLTMILTNPPFGAKVVNKRILNDFVDDGVALKNGKMVKSVPQEVLFVNRCLQLLTPGGKLGIVVPDGILANSSMQYVRDWILRWAKLKAVISLPQETFAPYGAAVKTSIMVLEKRGQPISLNAQGETESAEDDEVYMARLDHIGYDARGRPTGVDETAEVVSDFLERTGGSG